MHSFTTGTGRRALMEPLEARWFMSTALQIDNVQPGAFDQPRINAIIRRSPEEDPLSQIDPLFGGESFNVDAFFDTGASGVLLSKEYADAFGVQHSTTPDGQPVVFEDVGVGGSQFFDVSEPVYISTGDFPGDNLDDPSQFDSVYDNHFGPIRMQISQDSADELTGPLNVFGMPLFAGKVIVLDPKPVNELDYMRTYVYNPGTPYNPAQSTVDPGIPTTPFHVKLSYATLDRFTRTTPAGAAGPTLNHNPFIGPDPVRALDANPPTDNTPGITIREGNLGSTGSWLLDTGAQSSILSEHEAASVGVRYDPATVDTENPRLVDANGKAIPNQFTTAIGGIGGSKTVAGFYLDSLSLPTTEGDVIEFVHAPVLVSDITVQDPDTDQTLTLDGVFGMNYLVASLDISGGGFGDARPGPFDWAVIDEPAGLLGLQPADFDTAPAPTVTNVWVNGTGWSPNFRQYLQDNSRGDSEFGYELDGSLPAEPRTPWVNVNQVNIGFSQDVDVGVSDLVATGSNGQTYAAQSFEYDPVSRVATWTYAAAFGAADVTLMLDGSSQSAITGGAAGQPLDGDADGAPGGNFTTKFLSLPGDANLSGAAVNASDLVTVRNAIGRTATNGSASYSPFADLDGSGAIAATDLVLARNRIGTSAATASALRDSLAAAARAPWRPLFSTEPVKPDLLDG